LSISRLHKKDFKFGELNLIPNDTKGWFTFLYLFASIRIHSWLNASHGKRKTQKFRPVRPAQPDGASFR